MARDERQYRDVERDVFVDTTHEQARDILAQWRAETLAAKGDSQVGFKNASRMAEVFKALSDPTRVHMIQVLIVEGELSVNDLAARVEASQSSVSHHLRVLRHARLVCSRREGKTIAYSTGGSFAERMLRLCLDHLRDGRQQP